MPLEGFIIIMLLLAFIRPHVFVCIYIHAASYCARVKTGCSELNEMPPRLSESHPAALLSGLIRRRGRPPSYPAHPD